MTVLGVVDEFGGASKAPWVPQNVASSIYVALLAIGLPPSGHPPEAIAEI